MSGNQASDGAGIEAFEGARVTVSSSTIADNTATGSGGGLRIDPGGRVTASNTLVGDNAVVPSRAKGTPDARDLNFCYGYPMPTRRFRPSRRGSRGPTDVDALIRQANADARARQQGYRERSLALNGWICAKCAREFDRSKLHLLTVHHKDGNHDNNPPDGSNWENLCVDCHEDEHARGVLGDYLTGKD